MKYKKLYIKGQQIRICVSKEAYHKLKQASDNAFMTLEQYAGLVLSGFQIIPPKTEES